jgi:CRISPR/Cas system-associated exonuclease Cas4 (RecB family)
VIAILALIVAAILLIALLIRRRARRSSGRPLDLPVERIVAYYSEAHPGKLLQAAAYCLLLAEASGVRPSHATLRYADRDVEVPYTPQLEDELRAVIQEMRDSLRTGVELHCSHTHPRRCAACSKAHACGEALIAVQR